jgi:hypothetical protein
MYQSFMLLSLCTISSSVLARAACPQLIARCNCWCATSHHSTTMLAHISTIYCATCMQIHHLNRTRLLFASLYKMHAVTYVGQSLYYEKQAVTAAVLFIERCIACNGIQHCTIGVLWASLNDNECPWDENTCSAAAENGRSAGLDRLLAIRPDSTSAVCLVAPIMQ